MKLSDNKGIILLSTLIVLVFLAVMGLSLIAFVHARSTAAELELYRLRAFYLAESAIAVSINELKKDIDSDQSGIGTVEPTPFGGGTYEAIINKDTGIVTGIGEYEGVRREIEVKYKVL